MQGKVEKLSLANAGLQSNHATATEEVKALKSANAKLTDINFILEQKAMKEHELLEKEKEVSSPEDGNVIFDITYCRN